MKREEAINILRETHDNSLFSVRTALETLIPELRESKDERIRKWLFNLFDSRHSNFVEELDNYNGNVTRKEILAYLEKRKEFVSEDFESIWKTEDCKTLLDEGEKLSPRFKEMFKEVCHSWYDKGIEVGENVQKPFNVCEQCPYYKDCPDYNENKWSEEDENALREVKLNFELNHDDMTPDLVDCYERFFKKVKSLRPQPHTVSIKNATKFGNLEYERGVKDGIQYSENHRWKPSEEQLSKLSRIAEGIPDDDDAELLIEIYEHLTKL